MKAVMFDLDGTLLDIDLDAFLPRYFAALELAAASLAVEGPILPALSASVAAMTREHPGRTNQEVFYEDFVARTGVDLADYWHVFDRFYREDFPALAGRAKAAAGAHEAIATARECGMKVVVATNPIFPEIAVAHRLGWAGIDGAAVDAVTTYEVMRACKPSAAYFLQAAEMVGLRPEDCLMVGDDPDLDMPASRTGMRTFYVGEGPAAADMRGDLIDLAALLPSLA